MTGSRTLTLPRASVFAQLRPTPLLYIFLAVSLPSAMAVGGKEVARWQYLNDTFEGEWGIALTAAVSAMAIAVTSVLVGRYSDRYDPRPFLPLSMLLGVVANTTAGVVLVKGEELPLWLIIGSAVLDGAAIGGAATAILKIQASIVQPGAEGAAEILNILRLGIGGVLGALIAGASPSIAFTLLACSAASLFSAVSVWFVMRPVTPRPLTHDIATKVDSMLVYLRGQFTLRRLVVLDLLLALIVPTQLVNFVLSDLDVPHLASLSIAAGMAGVLVGRVLLTLFGFRGNPRVLVLVATMALALAQLASAAGLMDRWLIRNDYFVPVVVIIGSIGATYCQGLLSAMVQQSVEDEYRGRLGALLVTGRNVLISLGAIAAAGATTTIGSQALLLILAGSLIACAIVTRGYRWLAMP